MDTNFDSTISVLMPVYNRELYVADAIKSIMAQSYKDLVLIVYLDGCTDKTKQIVETFKHIHGNIKIIGNPTNTGVANARNSLLRYCNTKYAIWQDSDDISHIDRLKISIEKIKELNAPVLSSNFKIYHQSEFQKNVINGGEWRKKITCNGQNELGNACTIFNAEELRCRYGGRNGIDFFEFDESKKFGDEDGEWLRLIEAKYGKRPMLNEVLYYVRFHDDRIGHYKRVIKNIDHGKSYAENAERYRRDNIK